MKILPPRKKDWKKGTVQIGLFIRTEAGSVIETVSSKATTAMAEAAYALLHTIAKKRPVSVSEVRRLQRKGRKKVKPKTPESVEDITDVDPRELV